MAGEWDRVDGIVTRGHRVASGMGGDARFPAGTIAPQIDIFRAHIPDLDAYLGTPPFAGTINLDLGVREVAPGKADIAIGPVRWTPFFPPERFLISRCAIVHGGARYPALLYIPDPATKPDHPQPRTVVELLAREVPGLAYGDAMRLLYRPATLSIMAP